MPVDVRTRLGRLLAPALIGAGALAAVRPGEARPVGAPARVQAESTLVVRGPDGVERRVPLRIGDGPTRVRADRLADAIGGRLARTGARWTLRVRSVAVSGYEDLPFALADGRDVPLAAEPLRDGDVLWLPLQVATDLLPRLTAEVAVREGGRLLLVGGAAAERPAVAEQAGDEDEPPATRLPTIRGRRAPAPGAPISGRERPAAARATEDATTEPRPDGEAEAPAGVRRRMVVIDAGHGGPDAGMTGHPAGGPTVVEKQVTLGVARALREALAARGVGVAMTRTGDTLVALADRGRLANQRRGDLFVSLHVNAANPGWRQPAATRGFETYFLSEARTEDARRVEAMENEAVRFETAARAGQGDPLGFVLRDMAQNEHLRESSRLADVVQRRLGRVHPGPSRGVKQAGFKVLATAYMPAVLVELGYGTNAAEGTYLTSAGGQREIARALADAVVEYLAAYDRKVQPPRGTTAGARP